MELAPSVPSAVKLDQGFFTLLLSTQSEKITCTNQTTLKKKKKNDVNQLLTYQIEHKHFLSDVVRSCSRPKN